MLADREVRYEIAGPGRPYDRDATHGRSATLAVVALRALDPDLLAEALPGEQPDQVRGEQDRHGERRGAGDQDAGHRASPPTVLDTVLDPLDSLGSPGSPGSPASRAAATRSSPYARDA